MMRATTMAQHDSDKDPLTQLDDDDELSPEEETLKMDIPDGFRLQASPPPALDQSIVKRGVLVKLGLGWFGGVLSRRSHPASRQEYDYRVILH
ncbi:unnamed protein product [Ectocarpus sp. CCAP 1310/34]|nr:unnamed protein product [Ectocarpus sp. CCAP 1310/34]